MKKITLTKYQAMLDAIKEEYGPIQDPTLRDCDNIKDEDLPGLTLTWDKELNEWCVFGPLNQTVH
jgi:hypothetical protein